MKKKGASIHNQDIAILVLAAGSSSRMGVPKQLLPWKNSTLIEHSIDLASTLGNSVYVVLGASFEKMVAKIDEAQVKVVQNKVWKEGMGVSIAKGIRQIASDGQFKGVLVMLVDQPLLDKNHFEELIQEFCMGKASIISTDYGNKNGVPAIFDSTLFPELLKLNKDFGARHLIEKSESIVSLKPIGKTTDIDTLDSYTTLYKEYGKPN